MPMSRASRVLDSQNIASQTLAHMASSIMLRTSMAMPRRMKAHSTRKKAK